jgi:hypothetical protein
VGALLSRPDVAAGLEGERASALAHLHR